MTLLAEDCRDLICDRYDDRSALALARHAHACYECDPDTFPRLCLQGGWTCGQLVETGATQVTIAWCPWAIVVSARGSSQAMDWLEDLRSAWRLPAAEYLGDGIPGSIGIGFGIQAARGWDPDVSWWLLEAMKQCPDAKIYLVGHSLGSPVIAAMADLARRYGPRARDAEGYLFETPRMGDIDFAAGWDMRHPRFQSVAHGLDGVVDIVTRLPPRWTGARHVCRGRLTVLRGRYRQGTTEGVAGWRLLTRAHRSIRAHGMQPVLGTLERRIKAAEVAA